MKIRCGSCAVKIDVPDVYRGRTVKCPKCKTPTLASDAPIAARKTTPAAVEAARSSAQTTGSTDCQSRGSTLIASLDAASGHIADEMKFEPEQDQVFQAAQASPAKPVSPLKEFIRRHPKIAAALTAWALLYVVGAMVDASSPLWGFFLAALYGWLALQLYRLTAKIRKIGVTFIAFTALVLAIHLIKSGSSFKEGPSFAEFDGKFGATSLDNGQAQARSQMTGAQMEQELRSYFGRTIHWQGTVLDVQGNTVMIAVEPSTMDHIAGGNLDAAANRLIAKEARGMGQDDVQVILQLDDPSQAISLFKGEQLQYDGILSGVGNPYPYMIKDGRIK